MRKVESTFIHNWFQQVWNQKRREAIDDLIHSDAIIHDVTNAIEDGGIDTFKKFYDDFTRQYNNIVVDVEDVKCEGDMETASCRVTAFHIPSEQLVEIRGVTIVKLKEGKIAEAWNKFYAEPLENLVSKTW